MANWEYLKPTVASLTALSKSALVDGQYSFVPGLGHWRYDAASSATADGGHTLQMDEGGAGRFVWQEPWLSFELYDAVGDGAADDSAKILACLNKAAATGLPVLGGGAGKTYRVANNISVTRTSAPLMIDLRGAAIHCDDAGITIGQALTTVLTTTLSANVNRYDNKILLSSTTGLAAGQLLEINSPALTQGAINALHYYVIREVDAGVGVWIEGSAVADINDQQRIDDGQSGSIAVNAYNMHGRFVLQNGKLQVTDTAGVFFALALRGNSYELVRDMECRGSCRAQISSTYYGVSEIDQCQFADAGYISGDQLYENDPGSPDGLSYGYGALNARGWFARRSRILAKYQWHAVDASRGAMQTVVEGMKAAHNGYAVSCHEGSWYLIVRDCQFRSGEGITGGRCSYLEVQGCTFYGSGTHNINYSSENIEVTITDCEFDIHTPRGNSLGSAIYNSDTTETGTPNAGAQSVGFARKFTLTNSRFIGPVRVHAGFANSATAGELTIAGVHLYNGAYFFRIIPMGASDISFTARNFGAYAARLVTRGNSKTWITNSNGMSSTDGSGALIQLDGDGSNDITIDGCTVDTPYLVLAVAAGQTIKRMSRCTSYQGNLAGISGAGALTIDAAIANVGDAAPYPSVTVTSAVGAITI